MWSSVVGLALLAALNPVFFGCTLLVVSRPRPVQNLLVYWLGCLTGCIPCVVLPLTLLHVTPMFNSFANDLATSSIAPHIRIGMGVLPLSIAALLTVRSLTRRRQRAAVPAMGDTTSPLVLDSRVPPTISQLLGSMQDAPTEGESVIRRLLRRVHDCWESGSLWVPFAIGLAFGGASPSTALPVLAIIVDSRVGTGTQVSAAIAFVVGMLAVVEITLVSYLATPARTQAILQLVHEWALAHRRKIVIAMCTVIGVAMVARGMGGI